MVEIGRLLTAMVTPFAANGEIDYAQAKKLALALLASGSDGLVVSGTTGESPTLTLDEKLRLFAEVKEAVGDRGAIVAGTGNYCTQESVELTREAERLGVDAIMAAVPYYNKPPQEGLYEHFRTIAAATKLPVIPYNVPARTVTNLAPETTIRLSEIPNIVGIKEASGNIEQITKIILGARPGFRVWSGNDSDTVPVLAMGGYGVISVASHLVGRQIKAMIDGFLTGRTAEAAAEHRRLMPLVNALFVVSNPIPVKYALNQVGFPAGPLRLPLVQPDAKSAALICLTLERYAVDLPIG